MVAVADLQRTAYDQSRRDQQHSLRCLFGVFAHFGLPASMLDMGCGEGHLVRAAIGAGVRFAVGVDLNVQSAWRMADCTSDRGWAYGLLAHDLSQPMDLRRLEEEFQIDAVQREFDLVLCWEVAEHLPPETADTLCDTLVRHLAPGGTLVFTAAQPGQGGAGHLHEKPPEYWAGKLEARGLMSLVRATSLLRRTWEEAAGPCWWYPRNVQVLGARE